MSAPAISKIHLNLTRAFRFYPNNPSLGSKFSFLKNNDEFYEKVIKNVGYLGEQENGLDFGNFRSVLDTQSSTIRPLEETLPPDPFFHQIQDYYLKLSNLRLTPHYPCVVDILPCTNSKYKIDNSAFPGSLSEAKNAKLSVSIHIYPGGLAFLRVGIFLMTEKTFDVDSIIEFLRFKQASISIDGLRSNLTVEGLTKAYGRMLLEGLHSSNNKILSWEFTYPSIDIIESSELSLADDYKDYLCPLLCLGKQNKNKIISDNLSGDDEIILVGPESSLTYLPTTRDYEVFMNPNRRKVRRWIRNAIELLTMQRFVSNYITTIGINTLYDELQDESWLRTAKKGIIPPAIKQLYSYWNYTYLHHQNYPLNRRDWVIRYNQMLKVLDEHKRIESANTKALEQINSLREQAKKAKVKVSEGIWKLTELTKDLAGYAISSA